jgi:hypothetical protein
MALNGKGSCRHEESFKAYSGKPNNKIKMKIEIKSYSATFANASFCFIFNLNFVPLFCKTNFLKHLTI